MKRILLAAACALTVGLSAAGVWSTDRSGYAELIALMDSARVMETECFAPKTWEKAGKAFRRAQSSVESAKKQKTIDKDVAKVREYVENAVKATEVARLSLAEYLAPRDKAREAKAPSLVSQLYLKAEQKFRKATGKIESGDVKGGLKEAGKSTPLYDIAELEAYRVQLLGKADRLIEKAVANDADKYALSTLDKARHARQKADLLLTKDRYDRTETVAEADRAEYEAAHASNIALSVRALKRNDQAWEKLMMVYEIQMNRVGAAIGLEHLPFDRGPLAAADTLIVYIENLSNENSSLTRSSEDLTADVVGRLQQILQRFDQTSEQKDPAQLVSLVDNHLSDLLMEQSTLTEKLQASRMKLNELTQLHEQMSGELSDRVEVENKFKKARALISPSEGQVLFNAANDVVLRLTGLSFDIGQAVIKDEHMALLEKVKEIVSMYPNAQLMIEGHTDASGNAATNQALSEKRAFAVRQYLREALLISVDRIHSAGYGADRPIASNQTAEGRAKNRRNDIIIMQ